MQSELPRGVSFSRGGPSIEILYFKDLTGDEVSEGIHEPKKVSRQDRVEDVTFSRKSTSSNQVHVESTSQHLSLTSLAGGGGGGGVALRLGRRPFGSSFAGPSRLFTLLSALVGGGLRKQPGPPRRRLFLLRPSACQDTRVSGREGKEPPKRHCNSSKPKAKGQASRQASEQGPRTQLIITQASLVTIIVVVDGNISRKIKG
jgi:hypothetical protein